MEVFKFLRWPFSSGFNPEGTGYDYDTAKASGMEPVEGHWGSVAPVSDTDRKRYRLPDEAYMLLKGKTHETWDKAIEAEQARGFRVLKLGKRYYSVPNDWSPQSNAVPTANYGIRG